MKKLLLLILTLGSYSLIAQDNTARNSNGIIKVQTIDAQDSVVFDCSQLTGATGAIQIPVSIISDDTIYAVDFSLKYDHSALQYDTTIAVVSYLSALSNYNTTDSIIRFTSFVTSTSTPVQNNTTIALVKFILLAPSFNTSNLYTFKGYLNGTTCSIKYIPPSPLGINNLSDDNFISMYPNPAVDQLTVNFKKADFIELSNAIGEVLDTENVKGSGSIDLNTSKLSNGLYFVKLKEGQNSSVKKLMIVK